MGSGTYEVKPWNAGDRDIGKFDLGLTLCYCLSVIFLLCTGPLVCCVLWFFGLTVFGISRDFDGEASEFFAARNAPPF